MEAVRRGASRLLDRARNCYEQYAWAEAYQALSRADQATPLGAEDLELLAMAAYMVGRDDEYLGTLERAHNAHVNDGQCARAVRCGFWIGFRLLMRGEMGRASGWFARGQRLLEGEARDCAERGYLLLPVVEQRLDASDFDAAYATAAAAAAIGERCGDADLIACARHQQGRTRLQQGQVEAGLALLDETMIAVTAGQLSPLVTGLMYCSIIGACQQVYAIDRSREWTAALSQSCEGQPDMVAFVGTCQVHRAEIMQLQQGAGRRHRQRGFHAWLKSLALGLGLLASAGTASGQERTMIPVTVDGEQVRLAVISYKPSGIGPFPTLVFHHGSTGGGKDPSVFAQPFEPKPLIEWFNSRGWAVVLPARRGRGGSEGLYDEGFSDDRTEGYSCDASRLLWGAERALRDVDAITGPILALPFVDRMRIAVGGWSRGAILALAWAGQHPHQSRAVVNFVGGWRATSCASAEAVNQELFKRKAGRIPPSLWLYGTNDPFYSIAHSRANFAAFEAAGGRGIFYEYQPPPLPRTSGHDIIYFPFLWGDAMVSYLTERGLPTKTP